MSYAIKRFSELSDEEIIVLFYRMDREGSKRQVFFDGHIDSPWDFLNYTRSKLIFGGFLFRGDEPAACFWVSDISANVAFFHYWCYKLVWGKDVNGTAQAALKYLANNTHLTGLCGRTPASHKLAVRALKRGGFKILALIPEAIQKYDGSIDDAVVSFYSLKALKEV